MGASLLKCTPIGTGMKLSSIDVAVTVFSISWCVVPYWERRLIWWGGGRLLVVTPGEMSLAGGRLKRTFEGRFGEEVGGGGKEKGKRRGWGAGVRSDGSQVGSKRELVGERTQLRRARIGTAARME